MLTHPFVSGFYPFSFRVWFLLKLKCFWDKYRWEVLSGPEKVGFECKLSWVIGMKVTKETWKYEILNFKKNKIRCWLEAGEPITIPPGYLPLDLFVHNVSMKMKAKVCSVLSNSLRPHGLYSPWNSPGQNTGVGADPFSRGSSHQQGSNLGLLNCRQILYQLSYQGSSGIQVSKVSICSQKTQELI